MKQIHKILQGFNLSSWIDLLFQKVFYEFGKLVTKFPIFILCFSGIIVLGLGVIPSVLLLQFETKPERVFIFSLIKSYGFLQIPELQWKNNILMNLLVLFLEFNK
jgi:hypothetical protein